MPEPSPANARSPDPPGAHAAEGLRGDRALSWLYVFVSGFSGAAVMLVELAGIRLLSPTFGNSIDTWTALIGVVLVALSVGNALGGWMADRPGAREVLAFSLLGSGVVTMLLPPLSTVLTYPTSDLGPILGPLVLSLSLFVVPAVAFGMMSPLSLRLLSRLTDDRRVGLAAGITNGSSAIGSFVGTLATGYVLMRVLGIREIYLLTAALLLGLGVLTLVAHRIRLPAPTIFVLVACVVLAGMTWATVRTGWSDAVVHSRSTRYQSVLVIDRPADDGRHTERTLVHDRTVQGRQIVETGEAATPYQRAARLLDLQRTSIGKAAFVGGGMFGVPQMLSDRHPEAEITVLEIDPEVIEVARTWFRLDEFPAIHAVASDGRRYLERTDERFDFIFLDAYAGWRAIPEHLTTVEFFTSVRERLAPDGIVMMNAIARTDDAGGELFDALLATVSAVFGRVDVYQVTAGEPRQMHNLMFVTGPGAVPHEELVPIDRETAQLLERYVPPERYASRHGRILTDNLAPIQALVSRASRL